MNTMLGFRVPAELRRRVELVAELRGRTFSEELRAALAGHCERAAAELASEDANGAEVTGAVAEPPVKEAEIGSGA